MYKIKPPEQKKLDDFYKDYHKYILEGVDFFLDGNSVQLELKDKNKVNIMVGVDSGSPSEFFLMELKTPAFLKYLMTCAPDDLSVIVDKVKGLFIPSEEILVTNKLTLSIYKKYYHNKQRIDHFFTIMHCVFVDWVFDGERNGVKVFDKLQFDQNVGLSICPYCGAEDITIRSAVRKKVIVHAKPDVDHFLPKSKYPYLAMTYANLIPCSEACNRQLKRVMDPLVTVKPPRYRLMNPYRFDFSSIEFSYDFDNISYFKEESYEVKVRFPNDAIIKEGYTQGLGIDSLYGQKKNLIVDLYKQMAGWNDEYQNMLTGIGVLPSKAPKTPKPNLKYLFGYECDEDNSRIQPYFKFKYDIASQMIIDGGCKWPW